MPRILQIVTHINAPAEVCDTSSDNTVLVDCEDLLVLEDRKILIADCSQLARRKPLVLEQIHSKLILLRLR